MQSSTRYLRIHAVVAAGLAALALLLVRPARADAVRTGGEPWFRQASAEALRQAHALFAQAIEKHQQLLRGDALALYEQALALWDNPDIQWNLALVLEDLGQYLRAHEQLESTLRWGTALGPERLREVRDRMRTLETQRLARIETSREEPAAVITLDGVPWLPHAGRRSTLVLPGEHYLTASKPGYIPVTRSVVVKAGQQARVALPMDEDRLLETRRWTAWAVIGAGVAVASAGAVLERSAFADQYDFENKVARCSAEASNGSCDASQFADPETIKLKNRFAIGMIAAGGTTVAVGLVLTWLNRQAAHRAEPRPPSRIELTPILSSHGAELSALVRF
jgi:tetratricopeptide (TPR) repeat protein